MSEPISGAEFLNGVAWHDFVMYSYEDPDCRKAFLEATGVDLAGRRSPLDAMIDQATGADAAVLNRFVEWVTVNFWGEEEAPAAYREMLQRKRAGEVEATP